MKFLMTSLMLLTSYAYAGGPANIYGLGARLERIECHGAGIMSRADYSGIFDQCLEHEADQIDACIEQEKKRLIKPVEGAAFIGLAKKGLKTFKMEVIVDNKAIYNTIRYGLHGDADNGITLLFVKDLKNPSFESAITTNTISPNGLTTPELRVKIKNMIYFFTNGCHLTWKK